MIHHKQEPQIDLSKETILPIRDFSLNAHIKGDGKEIIFTQGSSTAVFKAEQYEDLKALLGMIHDGRRAELFVNIILQAQDMKYGN